MSVTVVPLNLSVEISLTYIGRVTNDKPAAQPCKALANIIIQTLLAIIMSIKEVIRIGAFANRTHFRPIISLSLPPKNDTEIIREKYAILNKSVK